MKVISLFLISLTLLGCASEQVKVDRASEVVKAGNQVVDATTQLFSQYRSANTDYIKAFYTANLSCDITPDFIVHIRTGAPGDTVCLSRAEFDKYRSKALAENGEEIKNRYYTSVNLSYNKVLLMTTTSLIDGLSKYMAALNADLTGDKTTTEELLGSAVANIGAVDTVLKSLNDNNIADTGKFKLGDYKDSVDELHTYRVCTTHIKNRVVLMTTYEKIPVI